MGKRGFSGKKGEQKIYLGQVCGCLSAGRSLLQRHSLYRLPRGLLFSDESVQKNFWIKMVAAFGGAESPEGDSLYAYPARESLWSPNGVAKIMQGAKPVRLAAEAFLLFVQKEPKYAWGCAPRPPNAKLRLDTNDVNIVRTAPQIRSQGACGAFDFGFCRDRIKNQPYKRRRVGRNLRLSRTDPALCSGQPASLRCILLSPQGLATLRGPQLHGAYRRVTGL